jgi:hypothetical protein
MLNECVFIFLPFHFNKFRLSARQALKHPYFREMYKHETLNAQDDESGVKKGFAPFKAQRRSRKKEKVGDTKARAEDDSKLKIPKQSKQEVAAVSPKPAEVKVIKGGREKGPPANAPVPRAVVQQDSKVSKSSVAASQKYPKASLQNNTHRDDRHKVRRSERDRDREERRRKRERRERRETQRQAEVQNTSSSVAPAGSQVLPPISKSIHGQQSIHGQPKSIQSLKIDMAPGVKHRSSHRHHHQSNHPKSHRMPGHKNTSYGGYNSNNYGSGNNYHIPGKKMYYSSVADSSRTHRSNRHPNSNRGYVGHHLSKGSSNHYQSSSYHKSGKVNRGKTNQALFGLPSNNSRQYGRFGYQVRKSGAPKSGAQGAQGGGNPGRYESPYSQNKLKSNSRY